jgi:hypothetical protein
MAFSFMVEMLNLRLRKKSAEVVHLHQLYDAETAGKMTPSNRTVLDRTGESA